MEGYDNPEMDECNPYQLQGTQISPNTKQRMVEHSRERKLPRMTNRRDTDQEAQAFWIWIDTSGTKDVPMLHGSIWISPIPIWVKLKLKRSPVHWSKPPKNNPIELEKVYHVDVTLLQSEFYNNLIVLRHQKELCMPHECGSSGPRQRFYHTAVRQSRATTPT